MAKRGRFVGVRGGEFAQLVHSIVIAEKKPPASHAAAAMGLDYHTFYARITNRVPFTAEEIRELLRAVPDPRLVSFLLRGTPYVPADRSEPLREGDEEAIHRGATRIVIEATDILEAVETALRDGKIDHRDVIAIRSEIEIAERALATLRARLRHEAPAVVAEEV